MQGIALLTIALSSSILTFFIQQMYLLKNKIDPIVGRSSHKEIATRTGGISLFLCFFGITLFFYVKGEQPFDFSILIPISIMFLIGLYDDFYQADYKLKLLMQIIVAKILIDQGYVIENYHGLFSLHQIPWWLAQLSTLFVFIVVVNAFNFIDGIDGLALTEFVKLIFLFELLSAQPTPFYYLNWGLIAGVIPLYYFNYRKKFKVFLGDAGSLFLGTLCSIYLFYALGSDYKLNNDLHLNKVIFTIGLALYPLIDLLRVFVIRIRNGASPFLPDSNHIHHIIFKHTESHFKTLLYIQLISLTSTICVYCFLR
jgi:UDP-N-acetylmuramyl pentapeptide phosphotransferase/UDP-N-acetylglucosamine-1-phosphate transferase